MSDQYENPLCKRYASSEMRQKDHLPPNCLARKQRLFVRRVRNIGDIEKAGVYTSLIREQTPLDEIDFDLVCEKPGLMAYAKKERAVKLGG